MSFICLFKNSVGLTSPVENLTSHSEPTFTTVAKLDILHIVQGSQFLLNGINFFSQCPDTLSGGIKERPRTEKIISLSLKVVGASKTQLANTVNKI